LIADTAGTPVARVESFLPGATSTAAVTDLYTVDWAPVPSAVAADEPVRIADLDALPSPVPSMVAVPALGGETGVTAAVVHARDLVRRWLDEPHCEQSILVLEVVKDDPVHAAVAGYIRSASTEHPGRFGIRHASGNDSPIPAGEPETRHGDNGVEAPRLRRVRAAAPVPRRWNPDRPVLITDGTGALGSAVARHLVAVHGVKRLLLTGQSGPEASVLQRELVEAGADVSIRACDVADFDAVAALLAEANPGAVVHIAGVLDDSSVEHMTPGHIVRVLGSKAEAASHLDALTAGMDLDAFVMFSSIAGVIGSAGQANYAAANSYLDALARDRRERGLPGSSIAWGLWGIGDGMGHLTDSDRDRLARNGMVAFDVDEGLAVFDAALDLDEPVVVAARLDFAALRAADDLPPVYR
ncbi:MAG: beta-ketoacyl reductase, partial [Stackebrandtia sp.]